MKCQHWHRVKERIFIAEHSECGSELRPSFNLQIKSNCQGKLHKTGLNPTTSWQSTHSSALRSFLYQIFCIKSMQRVAAMQSHHYLLNFILFFENRGERTIGKKEHWARNPQILHLTHERFTLQGTLSLQAGSSGLFGLKICLFPFVLFPFQTHSATPLSSSWPALFRGHEERSKGETIQNYEG